MGTITYTTLANLVAGNPENIADVVDCFQKITAQANGSLDANNIAPLGVTTALIAANAVTAAKIEAQQAWQTISISGTGITTTNLGYFKDSLGVVHFRGDPVPVTGGIPNATVIGTLPAGSRPGLNGAGAAQQFPVLGSRASMISISTAGVMTVVSGLAGAGAGETLLFSAIHLRAEN